MSMDHSKPLIVPAGADALGQIGLYLIYVVVLLLLQGGYILLCLCHCVFVCVCVVCVCHCVSKCVYDKTFLTGVPPIPSGDISKISAKYIITTTRTNTSSHDSFVLLFTGTPMIFGNNPTVVSFLHQ